MIRSLNLCHSIKSINMASSPAHEMEQTIQSEGNKYCKQERLIKHGSPQSQGSEHQRIQKIKDLVMNHGDKKCYIDLKATMKEDRAPGFPVNAVHTSQRQVSLMKNRTSDLITVEKSSTVQNMMDNCQISSCPKDKVKCSVVASRLLAVPIILKICQRWKEVDGTSQEMNEDSILARFLSYEDPSCKMKSDLQSGNGKLLASQLYKSSTNSVAASSSSSCVSNPYSVGNRRAFESGGSHRPRYKSHKNHPTLLTMFIFVIGLIFTIILPKGAEAQMLLPGDGKDTHRPDTFCEQFKRTRLEYKSMLDGIFIDRASVSMYFCGFWEDVESECRKYPGNSRKTIEALKQTLRSRNVPKNTGEIFWFRVTVIKGLKEEAWCTFVHLIEVFEFEGNNENMTLDDVIKLLREKCRANIELKYLVKHLEKTDFFVIRMIPDIGYNLTINDMYFITLLFIVVATLFMLLLLHLR